MVAQADFQQISLSEVVSEVEEEFVKGRCWEGVEMNFVEVVAAKELRDNSHTYYSSPLAADSSPLAFDTSAIWPGQPL